MSSMNRLLPFLLLFVGTAHAATVTHEVATADTGSTPNTSGAFTPASGDLLVVWATCTGTLEATATLNSSISGFTFTQFDTEVYSTNDRIFGFVSDSLVSDTSSQTVEITIPADQCSGSNIVVEAIAGMSRDGLDAIKQSNNTSSAGPSAPAVTFGASVLTGNVTLGAVMLNANPATVTEPSGWTESADIGHATPTKGMQTSYRNSGFTGTTITWGSSETDWAAIIVELDTSATGPTFTAGPTVGTLTTTTIPLTATSDTTGTWEAVACPDGQTYPTVAQVLAGNCTGNVAAEATFAQAVVATVGDSDTLTGLDPGTTYDVHSAIDATPDSSSISTNANVTTNSLPTFSAGPSAGGVTSTTVTANFTSTQTGNVYGVACPDGQAAPTVAQVKAGNCTGDIAAVDAFTQAVVAAVSDTDTFTGLSSSTTYDTHYMIDSTLNGDSASIASLADQTTSAGGAPGFTSGPTVTPTTNGFTIAGTITCTGTCTVEAVACNPGDAAPSNAELEAGQCGGGNTAIMNAQENWTTTVGDSFTLTAASKPARFDVYVAGTDGTNDTTVIEFANQNRSADSGQTIAVLSSVAATSIFDLDDYFDPDVAAGDVVEHDSDTNEDSGCSVAFESDGDFTLTPDAAGDCDGKRTFDISYQDVSSDTTGLFTAPTTGNFATDDRVCINNSAPESGDPFEVPVAWGQGEAIVPIDLSAYFTDADGDSLTYTLTTGSWPTGISQSGTGNKDVTGTPTTENETGVALVVTATDECGDAATFSFYSGSSVDFYVINTWAVPNLDNLSPSEAEAAVVAAAPWRAADPGVVITGYDCGTGQDFLNVATQDPVSGGGAEAYEDINVELVGAILPDLTGMTEAEAVAAIEAVCP